MIAIARRNLSCFISNPNSFLCNSNVHFFFSIHPFSTSRIKTKIIPSPEICDVLANKHQFPTELASLVSSRLPRFRSPKRADLVLSFLKENSFTTAQLQKTVFCCPTILGYTIEGLKFRFNVFQDLGLSPEDVAKMISTNPSILGSSMKNTIIPSLNTLKGFLGSNQDVARLLTKSSWFVASDLKRNFMPNVEILKNCGIPMARILRFLYSYPRALLIKPYIVRKAVDKAIEMGVSQSSAIFIHAIGVIASMSEGIWDVKLQNFRGLGFSDDDILKMFRKQPHVLLVSEKKMKDLVELVLASGKYDISSIVATPAALGCSIEKRLEPRLQILGLLESRNLIKKWPCLGRVVVFTDDKFFHRFIMPHYDEIGEEHIPKIYVGKKEMKLKEIV